MAKHVIFLGAGASFTSGYPLANELRLRMSSRKHFVEAVNAAYHQVNPKEKKDKYDAPYLSLALSYFDGFNSSIQLFRRGAFATVDEFCKLALGHKYDTEMNSMRLLCRFVLGLHNPEEGFENSDYYPFIQRLYDNTLHQLRDDVVVVTFNYEPYLEFLLMRAHQERARVTRRKVENDVLNSISSGFFDHKDTGWFSRVGGFSLLKLHGTISHPQAKLHNHEQFFATDPHKRIEMLAHDGPAADVPPIVFPWEVFDESGKFIPAKDFILKSDPHYYPLFKGIWERAKFEMKDAVKVSFVGLSMHPFLEGALEHLFGEKEGLIRVVVANPGNIPFQNINGVKEHPPSSPAKKVAVTLLKIAPKVVLGTQGTNRDHLNFNSVVPLSGFDEFILKEM